MTPASRAAKPNAVCQEFSCWMSPLLLVLVAPYALLLNTAYLKLPPSFWVSVHPHSRENDLYNLVSKYFCFRLNIGGTSLISEAPGGIFQPLHEGSAAGFLVPQKHEGLLLARGGLALQDASGSSACTRAVADVAVVTYG